MKEYQLVQAMSTVVATVLQSTIYGSMALSFTLGTTLQYLWGLVNTLQLVTHTPLFDINLPANLQLFLTTIFSVVNFDILAPSSVLRVVFDLAHEDEYEPYNENFELLGYDNSNFIYLVGSPLIYIAIYVVGVVFYFIMHLLDLKM
jgi:hypothetical protein